MTDQGGERTGLLLIFRDISEERKMRDSLKKANTKLSMMSMVIRHDTLNQVGIIRGYSELIASGHLKEEDARRYGERIKDAVKYIEHQFNFAQEYQGLGRSDPTWQWMGLVMAKARTTGAGEGLEIRSELDPLTVLADPLLEKVFTILLDNTRRHGQKARSVHLSFRTDRGACIVLYEDDGVGIPSSQKEAIFRKDFNPQGNMGLYVAHQIMEMNGGNIRETGAEGAGARFELVFPEGHWKVERAEATVPTGQRVPEKVS